MAARVQAERRDQTSGHVGDPILQVLPGGGDRDQDSPLVAGADGVDATDSEVVARAHEVCPYSNATRGNVEVVLTVA